MLLTQAQELVKEVRTFFAEGSKSSNKQYHVNQSGDSDLAPNIKFTSTQLEKFEKRNKNSPEADIAISMLGTKHKTHAALGQHLGHTYFALRGGNCTEMAVLCGYWANTKTTYNVSKKRVCLASLEAPGDHEFCIITDVKPNGPVKRSFNSVELFAKSDVAKKWLVLDPWLNVCCSVADYVTKGGEKLDKWGVAGKRISWAHGSKGPGWYAANGEYKTKFAASPVEVTSFVW